MKYGFTVFVKTPTRSQFRTWLCVNHTHMGLEPKLSQSPRHFLIGKLQGLILTRLFKCNGRHAAWKD